MRAVYSSNQLRATIIDVNVEFYVDRANAAISVADQLNTDTHVVLRSDANFAFYNSGYELTLPSPVRPPRNRAL